MRKFFCFDSASGCGGERSCRYRTTPLARGGQVYQEPPWEDNDSKMTADKEFKDETQSPKASFLTPIVSYPRVTRSLSLSSTFAKGRRSLSDGLCGSPSTFGDSMYRSAECSGNCHSPTSERTRTTRGNRPVARRLDAIDMPDSSSLSTRYLCSSENSPCRSPVPLRCRNARLKNILDQNRSLELYPDVEHEEMKLENDYQMPSFDAGFDGYLAENRVHLTTTRPPQARSRASSSLTYSKHKDLAYLFRREKDNSRQLCTHDWTRGDIRPASPQKHTKRDFEKRLKIFPGETVMSLPDYASKTTAEDVNMDSSNAQPTSNFNVVAQHCCTDAIPPYANMNDCSADKKISYEMASCFLENCSMGRQMDDMIGYGGPQKNIMDEELYEKHKEVEQMFMLLSKEDFEMEELRNSSLNSLALLQTIMNIIEDRRHLVLELSSQIKCRIAERSSNNEKLKQAILEADMRTRRLEKEKSELLSRLEKELDRRSSSWSLKLEKLPSEEQRLRERVRELTEQNVSLQREISLLKGNKIDMRSRIMSSQMQLNMLTACLKEARMENQYLHQSLSELQEHYKGAEEEHNFIRKKYKGTEKDYKQLQKVIAGSQRICSDQENIINVLSQGYIKEIGEISMGGSNNSSSLIMEQLRLTGVEQMLGKEVDPYRNEVEQMLKKEVESCRNEMESLRHENMCLLDRLQCTANGYEFLSSKFGKELHARVDCLKSQGLSLLDDSVHLSGELLGIMTQKQYDDYDGYRDCRLKYQNLKIKIEKFKESFPTILTTMDEKSTLKAQDWQSDAVEDDSSRASKGQRSEETLCSKELEIVQLDADLSSSARADDILQTEAQRPQCEFSSHTHMAKDMEQQIMEKDESADRPAPA